ncbi:hypothetical protein GCM10027423_52360 [Spirosoma arcticum]
MNRSQADTNRVKLLLDLSFIYVNRVGNRANDINASLSLTQKAIFLSRSLQYKKGEGRGYLIRAKTLREKGDAQQGKVYAVRSMNLVKNLGYPELMGYVYSELARYYSDTQAGVSSQINLNELALSCFVRSGDRKKQADVLKEMGDMYQLQGKYHQSISKLQRALKLYQSVNFPHVQGVYDLLGFISSKIGDYKSAMAYGLQAVKTAEVQKDSSLQMCTIYNRLGMTYQTLGQPIQAYDYYKKSLAVAQRNHHTPSVIYLLGNISSVYLSLGKPKEALSLLKRTANTYPPIDFESKIILATRFMEVYQHLGQYNLAQPYCDQVLKLVEKNGAGSLGIVTTYQSVTRFLLASHQYKPTRRYLALNELLCQEQGSAGILATNYLLWFRLDSTVGSYPSAIVHFQRYVALRDSLLTESKNDQIAQLEIQYQSEKKDQHIKLKEQSIQLLTEQGKRQQQELDQARMIRNSTFAGILLLILILALVYNRYRLRRKSNQLLEEKQLEINQKNQSLEQVLQEKNHLLDEKEWMLREIHHRVRNNLQIVISLLNSQAASLADKAALSAIQESQHRVQAMALIHQKLYQSEQIARVEMASYIHDLIDYLRDSYTHPRSVRFKLSLKPLELDVTLAVPLGLIINEAVTNALKYAFPQDHSGTISLSLQQVENKTYQLTISDDGVGLPADFDSARSGSLGMTLIRGLSQQLDGELTITGSPGVTIRLLFNDELLGTTYSSDDFSYRWHRPSTT